jgi:hypothetical protein
MRKHLTKQLKRRKDLFWLTVSETSVHHGGQEAERERKREREREGLCLRSGVLSCPFIPSRPPAYKMVPSTFRVDLSPYNSPLEIPS